MSQHNLRNRTIIVEEEVVEEVMSIETGDVVGALNDDGAPLNSPPPAEIMT